MFVCVCVCGCKANIYTQWNIIKTLGKYCVMWGHNSGSVGGNCINLSGRRHPLGFFFSSISLPLCVSVRVCVCVCVCAGHFSLLLCELSISVCLPVCFPTSFSHPSLSSQDAWYCFPRARFLLGRKKEKVVWLSSVYIRLHIKQQSLEFFIGNKFPTIQSRESQ